MRLLTRCDLDGLTCATLIGLNEHVDEIRLTHPQEIANGKLEVGKDDILANLPFRPGCGLWFDHHLHTAAPPPPSGYRGAFGQAPSAARLVYEYYGGLTTLEGFEDLVKETDRLDSADLTLDDILDPQGYIQLGLSIDARSGLRDAAEYFMQILDLLRRKTPIAEILAHPDVREHCRRLEYEDEALHTALMTHSRLDGNVIFTDFRSLDTVPVGNRFLVFALFPQGNVEARAQHREGHRRPMLTLGASIVNRTCRTNLGELAARFGGGGHRGAASIELTCDEDDRISRVVKELRENGVSA